MSDPSRFEELAETAERYGRFSLDNYAIIRSVAENVADGFCAWLGHDQGRCVYLVPPDGAWSPKAYQSGAFSVSGKAFLPLGPISFGMAVMVSHTGDWLRMVLTCSKKGDRVEISIAKGGTYELDLPLDPDRLQDLYRHLHQHLINWFKDQADTYEHGDYGQRSIGFDFLHEPLVEAPETADEP